MLTVHQPRHIQAVSAAWKVDIGYEHKERHRWRFNQVGGLITRCCLAYLKTIVCQSIREEFAD